MFLRFIKPKGKKHYSDYRESYKASKVHENIWAIRFVCYMVWFLCIPFLFMAYSETVDVFLKVTIACLVMDFLEKVYHRDYKYF